MLCCFEAVIRDDQPAAVEKLAGLVIRKSEALVLAFRITNHESRITTMRGARR